MLTVGVYALPVRPRLTSNDMFKFGLANILATLLVFGSFLLMKDSRTIRDRLRHTVLFNLTSLATAVPIISYATGAELNDIGLLGFFLLAYAVVLTPFFNMVFDRFDTRAGRDPDKRSATGRLCHAVGFELCVLLPSLPFVAWWLGITLWEALLLDIGFIIYLTLYTYVFNLIYDRMYPLPDAAVA